MASWLCTFTARSQCLSESGHLCQPKVKVEQSKPWWWTLLRDFPWNCQADSEMPYLRRTNTDGAQLQQTASSRSSYILLCLHNIFACLDASYSAAACGLLCCAVGRGLPVAEPLALLGQRKCLHRHPQPAPGTGIFFKSVLCCPPFTLPPGACLSCSAWIVCHYFCMQPRWLGRGCPASSRYGPGQLVSNVYFQVLFNLWKAIHLQW